MHPNLALPTIDDRPRAAVVIYDGNCVFCRLQVARLARWDRFGKLAFLSAHDPQTPHRYPDLSHEALMEQMYIVTPAGQRHAGAAALRYLSLRLPRLWALIPWLYIPGSLPLWQWLYGQVAKRRYRFGKTKDACENEACSVKYPKRT